MTNDRKEFLYRRKGELITTLEVAQAELKVLNDELIKMLNEERKENESSGT